MGTYDTPLIAVVKGGTSGFPYLDLSLDIWETYEVARSRGFENKFITTSKFWLEPPIESKNYQPWRIKVIKKMTFLNCVQILILDKLF